MEKNELQAFDLWNPFSPPLLPYPLITPVPISPFFNTLLTFTQILFFVLSNSEKIPQKMKERKRKKLNASSTSCLFLKNLKKYPPPKKKGSEERKSKLIKQTKKRWRV